MTIRIISGLIGVVIAIFILCFASTPLLPAAIAVLSVIAVCELYKANDCLQYKAMTVTALVYTAAAPFMIYVGNSTYSTLLTTVAVMMLFASYMGVHKKMNFEKLAYSVLVPLLISFSMTSLIKLNALSDRHGVVYIVLSLCGAWIADTAAYFTGTFLGKHKLCPEISPKKTIEGFAGGLIFNGLFMAAFNFVYVTYFAKGCGVNYISSFFLGVFCAALGTLGDLTASLLKRQRGIKDYGNIMPGHGGIMDRFDSVLFVAPFMYAYLSMINIYV